METLKDSIEIRSLGGLTLDEISEAFLTAFVDYNITFYKDQIRDMMKRRGVDFGLSFGVFRGGQLVSFVINGIGYTDGILTAYDAGTGTIADFRGYGLADRILDYSIPILRDAGVRKYQLEVLKDNIPALKIYARLGFNLARELDCYNCQLPLSLALSTNKINTNIHIEDVLVNDVAKLSDFYDFTPSWQNSIDSVRRAGDACCCLMATIDNNPVGFAIAEPKYGDITQIAVHRDFRRRGVGTCLLEKLSERCSSRQLKVLNVETSYGPMKDFLLANGFNKSCGQYEMIRMI